MLKSDTQDNALDSTDDALGLPEDSSLGSPQGDVPSLAEDGVPGPVEDDDLSLSHGDHLHHAADAAPVALPSPSKGSWLDRPLLASAAIDWEKAIYGLFIALAVISRLWDLGYRVMSHDETVHVQWSWYLFQGRGYEHTPLSHGPLLFLSTALSYFLFGDSDASARLIPAIMGIILVALPYAFRRWLGRSGALVVSFLFLISPSLLYYSRYARHDLLIIVWSLIALLAVFRYLEIGQETKVSIPNSPRPGTKEHWNGLVSSAKENLAHTDTRWLLVLAAALSLMFATKEVSFIYIAIFGIFLVLLFFVRLGAPLWDTPTVEQWGRMLLLVAVCALLVAILSSSLAGVLDKPPAKETTAPLDQALEPEPETETTTSAADLLRKVTVWVIVGMAGALMGYVGLLILGSSSHRNVILTIVGVVSVAALTMGLLMFSLNLVELFPIRHRDCGQAPVPSAGGEMTCSETSCEMIQGRCQRPVSVIADDNIMEFDQGGMRVAVRLTRVEIFVSIMLISIITLMAGVGVYIVLDRLMPFQRGERPALDLILFIGSFTLPSLSPLAIHWLSRIVSGGLFDIDVPFNALDYSEAGLLRSAGFVFIFMAISVAVGVWWDWRRWLAAAGVFYVIFVVLFTTVFTNGNGLASGTVGSLAYWLEQQAVERGSQPDYYYALWVPLYEYLPLIGFLVALLYALVRGLKSKGLDTVFVLFLFCWTPATWLAYSIAGEKMPWLVVHFAVPMIMASGWVIGKLIEEADWRDIMRRGGWLVVLIGPVTWAALVQTVTPWLTPSGVAKPFSGHSLSQLKTTQQFIAAALVLAVSLGFLYWVWKRIGVAGLGRSLGALALTVLVVLTMRTTWAFNYVDFDHATEFLVYAHSTPDVREVMEQVKDISRRTSGDLSLPIAYTGDGSYPFIWYLRNYPNAVQLAKPPSGPDLEKSVIIAGDEEWGGIHPYLGDNYICSQYNFLWWPMQDYDGLTWERVRYAITNPEMRAAVWDIMFRRDYGKYEKATGKTVNPSQWPLRDGFRFCVRRDVLAEVWSESAGPVEPGYEPGVAAPSLPDYSGLEQSIVSDLEIKELGEFGNLSGPHGITLDAEGSLYVADTNNHRIVKFSPDGQGSGEISRTVADTWDSTWWYGLQTWKPGGCLDETDRPLALDNGQFCEPWSVAAGPDGRVYVADTWNHRVQVFGSDGQFLAKAGVFGQPGASITSSPGHFYGPRDVAVDQDGHVYVSDTGNKRIQAFNADLNHIASFGGPGIIEGRLDEPVGVAVSPDSLLYVADTWNQRVQALTLQGDFVRQWPIVGWESQSTVNKPYLATDSAGRVYVSDPEGSRIIVFDAEGRVLATLRGAGGSFFQTPAGIALDAQDRLWISDAATNRLLRFPALDLSQHDDQKSE